MELHETLMMLTGCALAPKVLGKRYTTSLLPLDLLECVVTIFEAGDNSMSIRTAE